MERILNPPLFDCSSNAIRPSNVTIVSLLNVFEYTVTLLPLPICPTSSVNNDVSKISFITSFKLLFTLKISQANKTRLVVILYEMMLVYIEEARQANEAGDQQSS